MKQKRMGLVDTILDSVGAKDTGKAPKYTMTNSRPVPITEETLALGFDKQEEEAATCSLRNISKAESARRYKISETGRAMAVLMALGFVLAGDRVPWYYRVLVNIPIGVWIGYHDSAKNGI